MKTNTFCSVVYRSTEGERELDIRRIKYRFDRARVGGRRQEKIDSALHLQVVNTY